MAITITTNSQTIVISAGTPITNLSQISTSDVGYNNAQEELTAHEQAISTIPTTEKQAEWNEKQNALGFTPEDISNKKTTLTNSETDYPASSVVYNVNEKVNALESATGVTFTGEISLGKLYTQYATYTPESNLAVTLNAQKVVGGGADIRMIGNGTNTPTFAAFTKHPSSGDYINTLGTVNYIVFYFNGVESIYSINQL